MSNEPTAVDSSAAEARRQNVWEAAAERDVAFRAIGQEPGWLLEITAGEEILLVTGYGQTRTLYEYFVPVLDAESRKTQFAIEPDGPVIEIFDESCEDVMSGERFEAIVVMRFDDRQLEGCGRALQ